MKSARQLIEELNTLDENASTEAKTASQAGDSLMESVCAFANEPGLGGGYLILGVAPASDSLWPVYEVVGVPDADKLQSDIASQCATMFNTVVRPSFSVELIDGKNVVVIFVPEAAPHEKPIHFKNKQLPKSALRRIGSTDQQCTDDDMVAFYTERQYQTHDERILPNSRLDDLDDEAIELYRQLRADVDPLAEELKWDQNELLEALGAVKREDGELKPTLAGVLLFGKTIALRRLLPMMRVDYIRIPGTQWVRDPDRRFDTVEIRSPLIRAIQRARAAVLDDLPKAFSLPAGELQGKELPMLPDRVVREVIANAVMHRDYRVHGSIQIIRYANRLEVRNPGYSIKSEERLGEPGSQARNPKIAAVLHDVKFAESKGSGIRVMRELMAANNLGAPTLESDRTGNSFLAILLFHHFLGEDDLQWLHSFQDVSLDEAEMRAMISARELGAINNTSFRSLNRDCDTLSASKHLRKLVDCGLLAKKGGGAATYYTPTDKAIANWPPLRRNLSIATNLDPESTGLDAKKQPLDAKKQELDRKKQELDRKKQELDAKKQELPDAIRAKITEQGRKGDPNEISKLVLEILSLRPMTNAELANHLGRKPDYVRRTFLKPLLLAGRIRSSNPENPTDPNLKYSVVRDR